MVLMAMVKRSAQWVIWKNSGWVSKRQVRYAVFVERVDRLSRGARSKEGESKLAAEE
jgi:hypothetical protein